MTNMIAEKTDELAEELYNVKRDNQDEEEAVIGSHVFGNLYKVDELLSRKAISLYTPGQKANM